MLRIIDLDQHLTRKSYKERLIRQQLKLRQLAYQLYLNKRTLVVVYEGWDAAGKTGNINRLVARLDSRGYEIHNIASPTAEEKAHHYQWRYWQYLTPPDEKQVLIFEHSWYQRVLTERVEGYCSAAAWERAYYEINEFEQQLVDFGIIIAKFWIHISAEEQLRRLQQRQDAQHQKWKITEEHWNRYKKRAHYEEAVEDMFLRTSTVIAPWTIVEGEDKFFARVKTVRTLVNLLSKELNYRPTDPLSVELIDNKKVKKATKKRKNHPLKLRL
ncbi:MAG: hypothetical protein JXA33_04675 [Anaerolineae bacterium]|nr:hypothetical protein [Anaerolineae bacterium]